MRPLLFLDVDGPLLPYAPDDPADLGLARLNPEHGPKLAALGCELVWATAWETDANEIIAPRIGLPELPVVLWPIEDDEEIVGLHWKTRSVVTWAAGRAFVWVDDEITPFDQDWVTANHPHPALLHRVDPGQGLTDADFAALADWLRTTFG